jgi:hypothetical protein
MTLDYIALVLLIAIIALVIGAATWVSLLTLGALWPFLPSMT